MSHRCPRIGYSLIELLVVIGIIATLLALLVPAVQRVRSAVARTACANNLRQLALAGHQYHDVNAGFPSAIRWEGGRSPFAYMTWLAQLLPYVDQEDLWRETVGAYKLTQGHSPPYFPATGPHAALFSTAVAVFSCPADGRSDRSQTLMIGGTLPVQVGLTNYLGVNGTSFLARDGAFYRDSRVRIGDISDGASQTLFAGERPPSMDFAWGWWYAAAGQNYDGSLHVALGVQEYRYTDTPPPCSGGGFSRYGPGSLQSVCDIYHFWSLHVGGANFALADGSVRFLPYSAVSIMPALGTRAGREVVGLPD